jgi:hypothetical protein
MGKPTTSTDFPNNNRGKEDFNHNDYELARRNDRFRRDRTLAASARKPKMGARVDLVVPGVPVEIMGCEGMPQAGDDIRAVASDMLARTIADTRRLAEDYPEQARFSLGGLKPHPWTPPPMVFVEDLKRDRDLLLRHIDEDAVTNPLVDDDGGVVRDVDTDKEIEDMVTVDDESDSEASTDEIPSSISKPAAQTDGYEAFYEQNVDEDAVMDPALPKWDVQHGEEERYFRPFVIKAGTAGYLRMITTSIQAFNAAFPENAVMIVHSSVGTLSEYDYNKAFSAVDEDLDPNMECPILLFRTRTPGARVLKKASQFRAKVYEYAVFDDLLKHMVGLELFNKMFHDSENLRLLNFGESFISEPLDSPETVESRIMKDSKSQSKRAKKVRSSLMTGGKKTAEASPLASLLPNVPIEQDMNTYDPSVELATEYVAEKLSAIRTNIKKPVKRSIGSGFLSKMAKNKDPALEEAMRALSKKADQQTPVEAAPVKPAASSDAFDLDDAISSLEKRQ